MKKKQRTYAGMRPVFIKHFLRGSVKCLPYLGNLLDEIIFGVLDEESAKVESEKIHKKLDTIISGQDQQEADFAEILLALHIQTDVNETIKERLKEIEKSLRDDTDSPFPEYFGKAIEKVINENKEIFSGIQKLITDHDRQERAHQRHDQKLDKIDEKLDGLSPVVKRRQDDSPIQNLPFESIGRLFKGRGKDFDKLKGQLGDKSQATAITQQQKGKPEAIHGLGGIGKTRLAVEFGWYALEELDYKAVLFVNCGQELSGKAGKTEAQQDRQKQMSAVERLNAEMAKLASAELLDIKGAATMLPETAYHEVIKELQRRKKWLLVFDNVDSHDICNAVKATLPKLKGGKVIITSRLAKWAGDIKPLELKKLSQKASVDYLEQKTEGERPTDDNDSEKVKELAKELDGLPVALEQAAAYIIYESITFEQYLNDLHDIKLEVLGFEAKNFSLADYHEPVLRTWALTEQKLGYHAKAVLTVSAFLSADNIPESLLLNQSKIVLAVSGVLEQISQEEFKSRLNGDGDSKDVRRAIAQLNSYSMISRNSSDKTFSIHRMVQEATRVRLSDSQKELFTQLILTMIHNDFPDYQTAIKTNFSWSKAMDSHISGIIAFTKRLWRDISAIPKEVDVPLATQINNLAQFYSNQERFYEAEPLFLRAAKIYEKSLGENHPNVATALNNLALLYQATNRLDKAEPLMQRALAIDEASLGKNHSNMARDLNNLALLYQATNRLAKAEPLMKRVVEILENPGGEPLANYAGALNNLASLYQDTNRMVEAESLFKCALAIDEATFGKDHPYVAIDVNNLAGLYQATNRLDEAEPLMKRVVAILENPGGELLPNYAGALNNLASLYQDTNRLDEAEPLMRRALEINEASFGTEHPNVARDLNNLAQLLQATNRSNEAEPLMRRALEIDEASFGPEHPDVATALNNLAQLLQDTNRLDQVEPLMERQLVIFLQFSRRTGHPHPHLEDAIGNYIGLLMQMGHSSNEVIERLKRLAPEMFESADKEVNGKELIFREGATDMGDKGKKDKGKREKQKKSQLSPKDKRKIKKENKKK